MTGANVPSPAATIVRRVRQRASSAATSGTPRVRYRSSSTELAALSMGDSGEGLVDAEARIRNRSKSVKPSGAAAAARRPGSIPRRCASSNRCAWRSRTSSGRRKPPRIRCGSSRSSARSPRSTSASPRQVTPLGRSNGRARPAAQQAAPNACGDGASRRSGIGLERRATARSSARRGRRSRPASAARRAPARGRRRRASRARTAGRPTASRRRSRRG